LPGEVLDTFAQVITTALGLVAALAWNTAIQSLFTRLIGEAGAAIIGQFACAALITLRVICATIHRFTMTPTHANRGVVTTCAPLPTARPAPGMRWRVRHAANRPNHCNGRLQSGEYVQELRIWRGSGLEKEAGAARTPADGREGSSLRR